MSFPKKLKLTPDQLTKVKNSFLINQPIDTKIQQTSSYSSNDTQFIKQEPLDDPKSSISNYDLQKNQNNFYTLERLSIKYFDIETYKNITYELLVKLTLKNYPIILSNEQVKIANYFKSKLPFSACSANEYYHKWSLAKRRAHEWMRAVYIKNKCNQILNSLKLGNANNKFDPVQTWTTRQVLTWLRSHGYTPLELNSYKFDTEKKMRKDENEKIEYVHSYSALNELHNLKKSKIDDLIARFEQNRLNQNNNFSGEKQNDLEIIDVESFECETQKNKAQNIKPRNDSINGDEDGILLESHNQEGVELIREQMDVLGLKTTQVSLDSVIQHNEEEKNVSPLLIKCDLSKEFMNAALKRFVEDLIRQTCADQFETNQKLSQTDIFPTYLNVEMVYSTINKHSRYDFLTNKYMATNSNKENEFLSKKNNTNGGTTMKMNMPEPSLLKK